MGGRGSSSGISVKGKPYGSEYTTLYQSGNIKFIKYNASKSAKAPLETMTKGRVYAVINEKNEIALITYHDTKNKKDRQIDLTHAHNGKSRTHITDIFTMKTAQQIPQQKNAKWLTGQTQFGIIGIASSSIG